MAPFFEVSRGCFAQFDGAFDSGCVWLPRVSSPSVFIPRPRIAASRAAPVRLGSPDLLPVPATDVRSTQQFLLQHRPEDIHDPHVLALVCNALRAIDPSARDATPYLDRLDALKRSLADGKQIWWEQSLGGRTTLYGSGRSGSIETTALATLVRGFAKAMGIAVEDLLARNKKEQANEPSSHESWHLACVYSAGAVMCTLA